MVAETTHSSTRYEELQTRNTLLTAEEYFASCHLERSELIDGKVIELMPPGAKHGALAALIASFLNPFVRPRKLGRIYVETGYVLQRDPTIVRSPDVSFLEASRLEDVETSGFIEGTPTLAVEIVSPGDKWSEVESKTRLYLEKGTREVWIVEAESRTVEVRRVGQPSRIYLQTETLQTDVLPDFQMPLAEVFED